MLECHVQTIVEHVDASDGKLRVARVGDALADLIETVTYASLGQISNALFEGGGRYRRSM